MSAEMEPKQRKGFNGQGSWLVAGSLAAGAVISRDRRLPRKSAVESPGKEWRAVQRRVGNIMTPVRRA